MKVKFIEGSNSSVQSIDKLMSLVGSRKINSHSFQTYSIIKKEISIEEPITSEVSFNPKGFWVFRIKRPD